MIVYKLTDKNFQTKDKTTWGEGVRHSIPPSLRRAELCSSGVLHAYEHPLQALLLNPIHGNISNAILWEAETDRIEINDETKIGVFSLRTLFRLDLKITLEDRIRLAILLAKEVHKESSWNLWADSWLLGSDRTCRAAAHAAAHAADAADAARAAYAAYAADAARADYAAYAAAARAAAHAADAAYAIRADADAYAAYAAAEAAYAAAADAVKFIRVYEVEEERLKKEGRWITFGS